MAYMNQEKKKTVHQNLKPILAKYGMKGSLRVRNHMTLVLTLQSGKLDPAQDVLFGLHGQTHIDVNQYHFGKQFTGRTLRFLTEVFPAMKAAGWYDRSDAMVDYFDTAYYIDVQFGTWNKPYRKV